MKSFLAFALAGAIVGAAFAIVSHIESVDMNCTLLQPEDGLSYFVYRFLRASLQTNLRDLVLQSFATPWLLPISLVHGFSLEPLSKCVKLK
jgi:hypothetical protein